MYVKGYERQVSNFKQCACMFLSRRLMHSSGFDKDGNQESRASIVTIPLPLYLQPAGIQRVP